MLDSHTTEQIAATIAHELGHPDSSTLNVQPRDVDQVKKQFDGSTQCFVRAPTTASSTRGGGSCPDADGDGFEARSCGGQDCADGDSSVNPLTDVYWWHHLNYGACPLAPPSNIDCNCTGTDDYWECNPSPILIDISGDGFSLTDFIGGVWFDVAAKGTPLLLGWTSAGSDDAWLTLDRNDNGKIDNGTELFGNYTPQARSYGVAPNGFLALAEFDKPAKGGNNDGQIDARDARDSIFARLRLWQDINHNGVSEQSELHDWTLAKIRD